MLVSWTSFAGYSHQRCFATIAGQTNQYARVTIAAVPSLPCRDRLVGLVVKASASRAEDPEFESRLRRDFFGVESCQ